MRYCVKSVFIRSYSDQNNSEYGHFLRNAIHQYFKKKPQISIKDGDITKKMNFFTLDENVVKLMPSTQSAGEYFFKNVGYAVNTYRQAYEKFFHAVLTQGKQTVLLSEILTTIMDKIFESNSLFHVK